MRWLGVLALLGACGSKDPLPAPGGVSLVLDIPNGALDPKGFTTVEVVLHTPSGDVVRSVSVATDGTFDLGSLDPSNNMLSVEATLRNDSGAAVGYGRTAGNVAFTGGEEIVVPVRRPIAYIAGTVSRDISMTQTPDVRWTESPATFSDLSIGADLDGKTQVGSQAVLMIAAGPNLYMVTQAVGNTTGMLTGLATVVPMSTADHQVSTAFTGQMTGAVLDGAGTDDGAALVVGTSTQLFEIDTTTGMARALADGNFARVAVLTTDTGEVDAVAIKNRGATTTTTCSTSAELWWVPLSGGTAHKVATGGFSDIATDRGHAYYVDACKGELGELTALQTTMLRTVGVPSTQRPTALAVSNGQAYIGLETQPATTTLQVASLTTTAAPRTLWTETAQQVVDVVLLPEVRRQLEASSVVFEHLEIGAGGDYVALTTSAHFHGNELPQVRFPEMVIDTEELRVFDAATGGGVQRYRSWCDGVIIYDVTEIKDWDCAPTAGQTAAASPMYEHHINSMTFQFGKK